jgi:hypothetical protein
MIRQQSFESIEWAGAGVGLVFSLGLIGTGFAEGIILIWSGTAYIAFDLFVFFEGPLVSMLPLATFFPLFGGFDLPLSVGASVGFWGRVLACLVC